MIDNYTHKFISFIIVNAIITVIIGNHFSVLLSYTTMMIITAIWMMVFVRNKSSMICYRK